MSRDTAVQVIARGPRAAAEAAAAILDADPALEGLTYSILEEDEDANVWRIDAFPTTDEEEAALTARLGVAADLVMHVEPLADADWLAMALSGLPPVRAGRFFVYGAHDLGLVPPGKIALRIEAGAAFGTGHHGTTAGCLQAFDALLKKARFRKVLDVGTGTGVLAIAAARTGSRLVRGTDIDPPSVRIARENAKLNSARARFVLAADLRAPIVSRSAPYDLVFANILARPLIELSAQIRAAAAPGGTVILSGLLRSQERPVRAAYLAKGFRLVGRGRHDAWSVLTLRRL
ncbi:MAG: ribosomal protein methyltransferase [Caulobacteraceae bacterium]|nr:ribosomal protein methyltransferase [Caulobacteraceae bacterium]